MAKVIFKRYETDAEAQASNIIDGQLIITKEGTSYTDYGTDRVAFGGTPDTAMSNTSQNAVQNKVIKEYVDDGIQEAKDYVDNMKHKYIIATTTTSSPLSSNFKVNLNNIADSYGNFTLSNNAIVIGEGISKVRVSGSVFADNVNQNGYLWGMIKKNNSTVSGSIIPYVSNTASYLSSPITPTIISVQQGDAISLIADSTCGGTLRRDVINTWLLVEVIE